MSTSQQKKTGENLESGVTSAIVSELKKSFPKTDVHWRAQSVRKDGTKALALAYIDARDVMNRLDEVVGPENWQDEYEVNGRRVICKLAIRIEGEWIVKSDGAGDTAVESEKGGISDAFKRTAVKWGIGRYLYDMPCPWVACDSYKKGDKHVWSKWKEDPWKNINQPPEPEVEPQIAAEETQKIAKAKDWIAGLTHQLSAADDAKSFADVLAKNADHKKRIEEGYPDLVDGMNQAIEKAEQNLKEKANVTTNGTQ